MTVGFKFDWVGTGSSRDEHASATMAALSIEVKGETVTSVLDHRNRVHRDHIVVPLAPIAEWLAVHWWHLFHEVEDTREQRSDFEVRHNLAYAGDGFVLPSFTMAPSPAPERMRLQWSPYRPQHARIEFVGHGEEHVASDALEEQCRCLIEAVIDRLRSHGLSLDVLEDEWTAINTLDHGELEFNRAAALLGIDPSDVPHDLADAVVRLWEGTIPSLRDDVFATATADTVPRTSVWLDATLAGLKGDAAGSGWSELRRSLKPRAGATPWGCGSDLARSARRQLEIGNGRFDFGGTLSLPWHETRPPSTRIQGLVAEDAPACATVPRSETGKRFLLARAVGDYLGRPEPGPVILSSLATGRQAQSRAFAAEFLAPAESLRQRLGDGPVEPEQVDDLASEFCVSSYVIRHQIENRRLAALAGW